MGEEGPRRRGLGWEEPMPPLSKYDLGIIPLNFNKNVRHNRKVVKPSKVFLLIILDPRIRL
jgi:hypothetical protein